MIGGYDMYFEGTPTSDEPTRILRILGATWPKAYVLLEEPHQHDLWTRALGWVWSIPCQFYVFENPGLKILCDELGVTDDVSKGMISVYVEGDGVSFVVESPDSPTRRLVDSLR